jgi:hypothetical protein
MSSIRGMMSADRHPQTKENPMTTFKVGYLIGSLAKASINRKLALNAI